MSAENPQPSKMPQVVRLVRKFGKDIPLKEIQESPFYPAIRQTARMNGRVARQLALAALYMKRHGIDNFDVTQKGEESGQQSFAGRVGHTIYDAGAAAGLQVGSGIVRLAGYFKRRDHHEIAERLEEAAKLSDASGVREEFEVRTIDEVEQVRKAVAKGLAAWAERVGLPTEEESKKQGSKLSSEERQLSPTKPFASHMQTYLAPVITADTPIEYLVLPRKDQVKTLHTSPLSKELATEVGTIHLNVRVMYGNLINSFIDKGFTTVGEITIEEVKRRDPIGAVWLGLENFAGIALSCVPDAPKSSGETS